jgi:5'-deoxynucleotidase YfbR-like HD superfamily hydrolase
MRWIMEYSFGMEMPDSKASPKEGDAINDALLALGGLSLQFATINRSTLLADGVNHESDTDHTVMLGLLACALASAVSPDLDTGKVAQFALVHDLVEVYAGDTDTFGMVDDSRWENKKVREQKAFERIQKEFGAIFPWLINTIAEYESLESSEAKFIKTLDKALPKVTRYWNNGAMNDDLEAFTSHCSRQVAALETTYGKDQPGAISFYKYLVPKVSAILKKKESSKTE